MPEIMLSKSLTWRLLCQRMSNSTTTSHPRHYLRSFRTCSRRLQSSKQRQEVPKTLGRHPRVSSDNLHQHMHMFPLHNTPQAYVAGGTLDQLVGLYIYIGLNNVDNTDHSPVLLLVHHRSSRRIHHGPSPGIILHQLDPSCAEGGAVPPVINIIDEFGCVWICI
jgi:hypothetical protein